MEDLLKRLEASPHARRGCCVKVPYKDRADWIAWLRCMEWADLTRCVERTFWLSGNSRRDRLWVVPSGRNLAKITSGKLRISPEVARTLMKKEPSNET